MSPCYQVTVATENDPESDISSSGESEVIPTFLPKYKDIQTKLYLHLPIVGALEIVDRTYNKNSIRRSSP